MNELPEDYLGGDLFWWQEHDGRHTFITIRGDIAGANRIDAVEFGKASLTFALFDPRGTLHSTWSQPVNARETIFVDSRNLPPTVAPLKEGVLAAFVSTDSGSPNLRKKYHRLYSLVDWYSDDGDLVSLHNDQSFRFVSAPINFTEIVFLETLATRNFLVITNGPQSQDAKSVKLTIRNYCGESREAVYEPELPPFSLHKLYLNDLFPDLAQWCKGKHITLSGHFDCRGVFIRPYVMTEAQRLSGYHGGDLYQWNGLPRLLHSYLGYGEVNPMVALHQRDLTTTVNLLNTHGDLEDDFWVDARLFDESGKLVTDRKRWLLARRNELSRGDITELLPDPEHNFTGHIALSFSPHDAPFYPRRLQALLEYRTEQGAARVMAWSDIWNGQDRVRSLTQKVDSRFATLCLAGGSLPPQGVVYRSYYRFWFKPPIVSFMSVTNCGITPDYDRSVSYCVRLENAAGESLILERRLGPQATDYGPIDSFFPEVAEFLGGQPVAIVLVESEADLAIMHLTHNQASGVYSAEHFMDAGSYFDGNYYPACGS